MSADPKAVTIGSRLTLLAILGGTALLRLRLLGVPLERDEGEYAYLGQLILAGEVPYIAAHNMKLPGVYYAYAGILGTLGETDVAIRLGLLALNALAIWLVYRLGRTLLDTTAGLSAAAAYATLSLSASVAGCSANAEHFVVAPMLVGALLLAGDHAVPSARRIGAAGLALGIAVLMKQHGAAFVAFGALYLLSGSADARRCTPLLLATAAVPFVALCAAMYVAGAFEPFWFWTVTYAREYAGMIPLATSARWLGDETVRIGAAAPVLWLLAAVGLTTAWWDEAAARRARFLGLFTAGSMLAVALGLRFTDHYFILLLPAASLLVGVAASALARALAARWNGRPALIALALVGLAVAASITRERAYLLSLPPTDVARTVHGANPFPEAVEIARYLREHTAPEDRVAVIGSEPQIYFYADRRAATSYIYMYPLMEQHRFAETMQQNMIAQLDRERPPYLVLVNVPTSWSRRTHSPSLVLEWAERVVNDAYEPVGLAEILPGQPTRYYWDDDARRATPQSPYYVATFRRRS